MGYYAIGANPTSSSLLLTVIRSLYFGEDRTDLLRSVSPDEWPHLLSLTDHAHVTLPLAIRCRGAMPEPIRVRVDACLARNARRHTRVVEAHAEIAEAMRSRGAEFLVLKGLTHSQFWNGDSRYRPQYDVDLYCPPDSIQAAAGAAASLGYEPVSPCATATEHLPVMIRRTGWRWRGDYYDPDQPLALELHHRLRNPTPGFSAYGANRFWTRRRIGVFDGVALPALHPVDDLTFAAWHAARHMLVGSLLIGHAYELAHFLHHTAGEQEFWREWRDDGVPADRLAESVAFRLAKEWFGCRMNPVVEDYACTLPENVERWFRLFTFSSIAKFGYPNKDEIFLNLCLARNKREFCRVAARRIFPVRLPTMLLDAHVPVENLRKDYSRVLYRAGFIARRAVYHLRALAPVVRSGFRWWLADRWNKWLPETQKLPQ